MSTITKHFRSFALVLMVALGASVAGAMTMGGCCPGDCCDQACCNSAHK
jgi:hypothetical protein